ncbi:hypothetical protein Kpol_1064p14 [Vanderwaltozyma polyspora DSM 70294]|uniref:CWH43-like N-terminal domain-containing protein n=1 Tax=Vanderwaltozyma polyspora (strain ATCC 22028 / DSM 70294 / BCRC 21397 / CBS 2163 / NBRC 10782 / NRRL Y-8283 / UCD 57-17) TaxID=436907 RepID=A7TMD9_VANPO|nr:uncharacterized protein Kpol_1064p14 [Vanderwaltozyma polyspora DSM 70294]EDO16533.1 hypothetical protein Kpol_1064p14 [Vanderwaltozyma polyspora DSM 70294]
MSRFSIKRPGNYFFIVPWIAFIPWWGMLIAMLACWAGQGHPIYWFMNGDQFPVYISDIGATNLQPLFISCSGWQGLGYVISIACEFFQRSGHWPFRLRSKKYLKSTVDEDCDTMMTNDEMKSEYAEIMLKSNFYMPPWYTVHDRNFIFAAFIFGLLGEVCLLMASIFSTAHYHHVHIAMVVLFVILMFISVCCLIAEYASMGKHYALLHPLANPETTIPFERLRWYQWSGHIWNKFTLSAAFKAVWLTLGVVWAICFGACGDSISACFEWLLAFWFGLLFISISVDFYLGGRYKYSKYFHQVQSFHGYYKYDKIISSSSSSESTLASTDNEFKHVIINDTDTANDVVV